jgi:SAM-dependent methyltransferase
MAWNAGYVADIPYISNFIHCLSPSWLNLAALAAFQQPPDTTKPYRYLDLGCGYATTPLVLAATNPHAEFVGVDFMPEHIAFADRVIARTKLTNLEMIEASFEDIVNNPAMLGEKFDYIVLHGVYTWVSEAAQASVIHILEQHLKPGGLVYIGYNALPGWTAMLPVQRMLYDVAATQTGTSIERLMIGTKRLIQLREADASILRGVDISGPLEDALTKPEELSNWIATYLAHEYLNEHWKPIFFTDMCKQASMAKLTYLGDVRSMSYIEETFWTPEQNAVIKSAKGTIDIEAVKDSIHPSSFRRDIFVRGRAVMPAKQRDRLIANMYFGLTKPVSMVKAEFSMRQRMVSFDEAPIKIMAEALAQRPMRIFELQAVLHEAGHTFPFLEIAAMLTDTGQAAPVTNPGIEQQPLQAFNLGLMEIVRETLAAEHLGLASPALGSGIALTSLKLIAYDWIAAGKPESAQLTDDIREAAAEWEPIFRGLGML